MNRKDYSNTWPEVFIYTVTTPFWSVGSESAVSTRCHWSKPQLDSIDGDLSPSVQRGSRWTHKPVSVLRLFLFLYSLKTKWSFSSVPK